MFVWDLTTIHQSLSEGVWQYLEDSISSLSLVTSDRRIGGVPFFNNLCLYISNLDQQKEAPSKALAKAPPPVSALGAAQDEPPAPPSTPAEAPPSSAPVGASQSETPAPVPVLAPAQDVAPEGDAVAERRGIYYNYL